jgi:GNAT superfamily N-acetyltransferase
MRSDGTPRIRLLTDDDLRLAVALSTSAGWNQQLDDWRMLRSISVASFGAEKDNGIVGTAIAIDYGRFAWIAMMLVAPAFRSQGLGARLLEAALSSLPADRPVRLDATPAGRPLYERYRFEDESRLTRFVRPAASLTADRTPAGRAMTPADLPIVTAQDAAVFGGDRSAVLAWALQRAPQYARIIAEGDRAPQYVFGRTGRVFDQIGPVVAADDPTATALVQSALVSADGRSVAIDAFESGRAMPAWLRAAGFVDERPLFRMRRRPAGESGGTAAPSSRVTEFAIAGPDFA